MACDLANLSSVRDCAEQLRGRIDSLDLLVNNAGMMTTRYQPSTDGVELTFATNYLGPFLLTLLLLERLTATPRARIVNVASKVHAGGVIEPGRLPPGAQGANGFSGMQAYACSKLGNVMFTLTLAERLAGTGITANCLHPGVVATNITGATNIFLKVGMKLAAPFMFNHERGAETTVYLATDPALESVSGCYFDERQRPREPAPASLDRRAREALWDWSCDFCGVRLTSSNTIEQNQ